MDARKFHPNYDDKFPAATGKVIPFNPEDPRLEDPEFLRAEVERQAQLANDARAGEAKALQWMLKAQKRFARLAELLEEIGLELEAGDERKEELSHLVMDADNGRRAMEEARRS